MRHLCGLGVWDDVAWREDDTPNSERLPTNWTAYVRQNRRTDAMESDGELEEGEESEEVGGKS